MMNERKNHKSAAMNLRNLRNKKIEINKDISEYLDNSEIKSNKPRESNRKIQTQMNFGGINLKT